MSIHAGFARPVGGSNMNYPPMTLADLAGRLSHEGDAKIRWKHVWEFFEEFRWAPVEDRARLLSTEPPPTGDQQWDVLVAAMAEHLAAELDLAPRIGRGTGC
jgi:hypothetical protein